MQQFSTQLLYDYFYDVLAEVQAHQELYHVLQGAVYSGESAHEELFERFNDELLELLYATDPGLPPFSRDYDRLAFEAVMQFMRVQTMKGRLDQVLEEPGRFSQSYAKLVFNFITKVEDYELIRINANPQDSILVQDQSNPGKFVPVTRADLETAAATHPNMEVVTFNPMNGTTLNDVTLGQVGQDGLVSMSPGEAANQITLSGELEVEEYVARFGFTVEAVNLKEDGSREMIARHPRTQLLVEISLTKDGKIKALTDVLSGKTQEFKDPNGWRGVFGTIAKRAGTGQGDVGARAEQDELKNPDERGYRQFAQTVPAAMMAGIHDQLPNSVNKHDEAHNRVTGRPVENEEVTRMPVSGPQVTSPKTGKIVVPQDNPYVEIEADPMSPYDAQMLGRGMAPNTPVETRGKRKKKRGKRQRVHVDQNAHVDPSKIGSAGRGNDRRTQIAQGRAEPKSPNEQVTQSSSSPAKRLLYGSMAAVGGSAGLIGGISAFI